MTLTLVEVIVEVLTLIKGVGRFFFPNFCLM